VDLNPGSLVPSGDTLAAALNRGEGSVFAGFEGDFLIEARLEEGEIRLSVNLGGSYKPTRPEAEVLLQALEQRVHRLSAGSESFSAAVSGLTVVAELYVFSGPMDFPVAERAGGQTRWFVDLEN
jgi:hypothetical protein